MALWAADVSGVRGLAQLAPGTSQEALNLIDGSLQTPAVCPWSLHRWTAITFGAMRHNPVKYAAIRPGRSVVTRRPAQQRAATGFVRLRSGREDIAARRSGK
ncbi:hypothetical protein G7046_g3494 [Stylonectria norvegica]|nr:hypothetical protein G7046_g3494 [Stylonectria norvegica]